MFFNGLLYTEHGEKERKRSTLSEMTWEGLNGSNSGHLQWDLSCRLIHCGHQQTACGPNAAHGTVQFSQNGLENKHKIKSNLMLDKNVILKSYPPVKGFRTVVIVSPVNLKSQTLNPADVDVDPFLL